MKKTLTSVVTLALLSLSLTGCGNKGKKIHLQLVPSNDPAALMTRAKALAPILDKYAPGYSFSIDVGAVMLLLQLLLQRVSLMAASLLLLAMLRGQSSSLVLFPFFSLPAVLAIRSRPMTSRDPMKQPVKISVDIGMVLMDMSIVENSLRL